MKTIKEWQQRLNVKNISSFFEITLAVVTIGLIPICVSASEYRMEYYAWMIVFVFLVTAIIAWRKLSAKRTLEKSSGQLN